MRWKVFLLTILILCSFFSEASADAGFTQRNDVKAYMQWLSHKYQFNPAELAFWFNQVTIQPAIIESISRPYEAKPWNIYQQLFLQDKRIQLGTAFYKQHQATLEKAEKEFGVPAPIIVAILGVETYYGAQQGTYKVMDALSTLAFNYPPRAPFFKKELTEFLLLSRQINLDPTTVQGSYAGAIGQPQFMPSSYRYYAVDFSGEGKSDLRGEANDAIYSIANYLKKNGWRTGEPIAAPAKLRGTAYQSIDTNAKIPLYSMRQLSRLGVTPLYYPPVIPEKPIGLIQLNTEQQPEYWIAFNNFYVITRYNTSKQYAMAVFLLAAEIQRRLS